MENSICFVTKPTAAKAASQPAALIIEDMQVVHQQLRPNAICDHCTHNELMSISGEVYFNKILKGSYSLLWISTPSDWYARTPHKRSTPHWQRILRMIEVACDQKMLVIVAGPPGFFWKLPNARNLIDKLALNVEKVRLCNLGQQFAKGNPSGSHIVACSNLKFNKIWPCPCRKPMNDKTHALD